MNPNFKKIRIHNDSPSTRKFASPRVSHNRLDGEKATGVVYKRSTVFQNRSYSGYTCTCTIISEIYQYPSLLSANINVQILYTC